ncbi:ABC transporter substrate-binding protein [Limnohabitans planktonicus]|nr:ABC transporter substrate-binding protein [Limnohabitans planktonicus]|eukprot:gene15182-17387_t
MKLMKKLTCALALGASLATPAAFAQSNVCSPDQTIKFAGITWESGQLYTSLIRNLLEMGYGCKTEVVTGSSAATETALVGNDLQVWVEQWNRTDIVKKGQEMGKIRLVGDLLSGGGAIEGFFVPDYVVKGDAKRGIKASAPDLKSVSDLPKYKALFKDDEEPGKGRLLSCPVGWDCEKINTQKLKAYKLEGDYTNFRAGTGAALDAAITSAIERGKPILFYYWSPASLMGKYKLVQLQEPTYNEKCWDTLKDIKVKDVCPSASPKNKLTVGVSTPFATSNPGAVAVMEKLQLNADQINGAVVQMTDRKASSDVVAREFMKANPAVWQKWVSADAANKINAALK